MPFKNLEARREYYQKNKDKINAHRREYNKREDILERKKEQEKEWRKNNKELITKRNKKYGKEYREKIKEIVFNKYGRICECCGEKNSAFLTIDHINGDGTNHRKKINNNLYLWLVRNNFPEGFQTLCFNCNWGKYYNDGICPHKNNSNKL